MKHDRHLAVLFGAGATRGALMHRVPPPPLDQDFFDIAGQLTGRGTPPLAKRIIKDVFDLYGRVSGIGLEQYFRDIEARAEIGRFARPRNQPKNWGKRQGDLVALIRRVMIHTTCDLKKAPARADVSQLHRDVLRHLVSGDTLITFNYDTIIEESFPKGTPLWNPKDGYGTAASGFNLEWAKNWKTEHVIPSGKSSQIHLLKLHGSLNWTLRPTRQVRLTPRPYIVRTRRGKPVLDKCSILPPGWHKQIDVKPFRGLWREARLKLESCSSLAIIGYSLPETDLLAKALFAEVSRLRAVRRDFLRHLYLADPSEAVKRRFLELFAPALGPTGRVYLYDGIESLQREWRQREPKR